MGYTALLERIGQVNDLINAKQILAWDARTMMPPGGAETRAKRGRKKKQETPEE